MRKKLFLITIISTLFIQGCGTPQVVKSLSEEQLSAQKASRSTISEYFSLMEKVVGNQIAANKAEEDRSLKKEISIYKKKYDRGIAKSGADKTKLLNELSDNIKNATEVTINIKKQYDGYLIDLQRKHSEILSMMDNMVVAQEILNTYIQIEKADEAIGNSVFSALGSNQETIRKHTDEVNDILTSMKAIKGE